MFIFGFKHDRSKLLEVERKAKMEERKKLDVYYQKEIDKIRREHIRILDEIHKKSEMEKKESITNYKRETANDTNQMMQHQKSKFRKMVKEKDNQIEALQKDIQLLKQELGIADQKLQRSQKAYTKYREYVLQTFRYASQLSDEVKEIFSVTGNLFQRFTTIRDKIEHIDNTNTKYGDKILSLLDMENSDILLCLKNLDELREIECDKELKYER